jgi:hypothetical protein
VQKNQTEHSAHVKTPVEYSTLFSQDMQLLISDFDIMLIATSKASLNLLGIVGLILSSPIRHFWWSDRTLIACFVVIFLEFS